MSDGLVFKIDTETNTAKLIGSAATPPKGDLLVPASVTSGTNTYEVTSIAENAFAKCPELTSISLPATLREVDPDAVAGCTSLKSITISAKNETFASHDSMLFTKDYTRLLLIPEGMEGAANIPGSTQFIPAQALSRCRLMGSSLTAGDGSTAFTTLNGMLFSKDMKTLVSCPPAIGKAVVLPAETETIGEYALAGCKELTSITALGNVSEINATAFAEEVKATAVVVLPAGESKAVWEQAGFQHFAEPAEPGASSRPEADAEAASGLVFTLLDDYTLSVAWEGVEDPAANLEIPSSAEINGVSYRVSTIATNAFANRGLLTSVILPASITSIGEAAFAGCANLTTVNLPDSLQVINERAFEATEFSNVWLPASVQFIGPRAFASCESLTRIVALGTPEVADDALAGCANLSIYSPYNEAGSYPWNLGLLANNNHVLPYGLALLEEPLQLEVGQQANLFDNGLNEAPEPSEVSYSYAAKPLSVDPDGAVTGKSKGTSEVTVTLTLNNQELARATRTIEVAAAPTPQPEAAPAPEQEESAVTLASAAPQSRLSASGVEVISDVVSLAAEVRVFDYEYQGSNLRYQVVNEPSGTTPGTCYVLGRSYSVEKLEGHVAIPEKAIDVENGNAEYNVIWVVSYAFRDELLTSVSLSPNIVHLDSAAFWNCNNLTSFLLPKTVKSMGFNPFLGCKALEDLRVEKESEYFYSLEGAIYSKNGKILYGGTPASLKGYFTIPDGVERVRVNAFSKCDELTGIFIPQSVNNFGDGYNIIGELKNLKDVDIDPNNQVYAAEDGLIYLKSNNVLVTLVGGTLASTPDVPVIPSTVTKIGKAAFTGKLNVRSTVLPALVTEVGVSAFRQCANFTHAAFLNSGSTTFDSYVFGECPSLRELLVVSSNPQFQNTEGSDKSDKQVIFNDTDTRQVTVHCPASAQEAWAAYGVNAVPFATNMPTTIGVSDMESGARQFNPSIPSDSAFAQHVKLVHTFDGKTSGITADLTDPTGRTITFTKGAGSGPATLTSKLVYKDGFYDEVVLAESTSTVVAAGRSGDLPTVTDPNNKDETKASWSLSSDGVLTIKGTEKIADFGWKEGSTSSLSEHWGPLRDSVTAVDTRSMQGGASSMASWFADMPRLSNVDDLVIPDGVEDVSCLLKGCALETLPDDFTLPQGVKKVDALFASNPLRSLPAAFVASFAQSNSIQSCRSMLEGTAIEYLPESFVLPSSVTDASWLFSGSKLTALSQRFFVPSNVSIADGMFYRCSYLVELPEAFVLAEGVTSAVQLFDDCASLISIPETFSLPSTLSDATKAAKMFANCKKLLVLPEGFTLPAGFDLAAVPDMFSCRKVTKLYYAGSDAQLLQASESFWTGQKRQFIPIQAGTVQFKLSTKEGADFEPWAAVVPDAANGTVPYLAPPDRTGQVFTLWYADEACTQRFDFSKRVAEQLKNADGNYVLYGKYAAGSLEGPLPTFGNTDSAFWSLADDGTLYIRGNGKVDLGWPNDDTNLSLVEHWLVHASKVNKIAMSPALDAVACDRWFMNMPNLTDISQVHIPKSATSVSYLFRNDSAITSLPEDMTIHEGVTTTHGMFYWCSSLESLPKGFSLPSTLVDSNSMFGFCKKLKTIPEGCAITHEGINADWMFGSCVSLQTLSPHFSIPEKASVMGMFQGCESLASLPEGFFVPHNIVSNGTGTQGGMYRMFWKCKSLTTLPQSFDFPRSVSDVSDQVFFCEIAEGAPRVATYYRGKNEAVIGYHWEGQNRSLITEPADANLYTVTYKTMNEDGTWSTYATATTDRLGMATDLAVTWNNGHALTEWSGSKDCTEPFDFSQPLTENKTLYGKWIMHGGRYTAEGTLPVVDNKGSAWWWIALDGEMVIDCEGGAVITAFDGWQQNTQSVKGYWGPYREKVKSVSMAPDVDAASTASWFYNMKSLQSTDGIFVPKSCTDTHYMFASSAIESIPSGFNLPTHVMNMGGMFEGCESLTSVASDFVIPGNVKQVWYLFSNTGITAIPDGVRIPQGATNSGWMFSKCAGLTCIPEDFSIPATIENVSCMFAQCPNLTVVPAKLLSDLAQLTPTAKETINDGWGMFGFSSTSLPAENIVTYSPATEVPTGLVKWNEQHRTLETTIPAGKKVVTLLMPRADGTYDLANPYATLMTDGADKVLEPLISSDGSRVFVGWFVDVDDNTVFDFNKTVAEQFAGEPYVLYAKYVGCSGLLPTTDGGERASWELTNDGTLRISCEPGATIADFGWIHDFNLENASFLAMHWGPVRDKVKNVVMEKGLLTENMDFWFADMSQLKDCSEVFIPEGVTSMHSCFRRTGLAAIPEGFVIPNTVESLHDCFYGCRSLSKIAEDFSIPNSVTDMGGTFVYCSSLTSLPSGFQLPENLENAVALFRETKLTTFPDGFTLPATVTDASYLVFQTYSFRTLPTSFLLQESATGAPLNCERMFRESGLTSLPVGFTIPARVTNTVDMFYGTQLTSLPEGFAFEGAPTNVQSMFMNCAQLTYLPASLKLTPLRDASVYTSGMFGWSASDPGYTSETVTTYYAGNDPEVLRLTTEKASVYWKNTFNRTLLWNGADSDSLPDKMFKVSFQLQKPDAAQPIEWMTVLATVGEDGVARVTKPEEASEFGYVFDGWYTDPTFATDSKVAFAADGTTTVTSDLPLYGRYILRVSYDIPVAAKVTVDSSGNVEADAIQMKSFTPKPLDISSVSVADAPGAAKLFPNANERSQVLVVVGLDRTSCSLALGESCDLLLGKIPAATPAEPGVLDGQLSIDRKNAQLNFQPGEDITSFAKLTWTISPAA